MRRQIWLRLRAGLLPLMLAGEGSAGSFCDPGLVGDERSPMAYQQRGDRCEGIYKLEVNSEQLRLLSLVESFAAFDPGREEDLELRWSAPPELAREALRIRAADLDSGAFYRMDTRLAGSGGSFTWPLEILDRLDLTQEELGVRAWIAHPRPPHDNLAQIYLPLRIAQGAEAPRQNSCHLMLLAGVRMKEIYLSVAETDLRGEPLGPSLVPERPLGHGYYPAGAPIEIDLPGFEFPGFPRAGYFLVDLRAEDAYGAGHAYRFLLYHQGGMP